MKNFMVLFILLSLISCGGKNSSQNKFKKKGSYFSLTIDRIVGSNDQDTAFFQILENTNFENINITQDIYNCIFITGGNWISTGSESNDICFDGDINRFINQANLAELPFSYFARFQFNVEAIPELIIVSGVMGMGEIIFNVFNGYYSEPHICSIFVEMEDTACYSLNPSLTIEVWAVIGL